MVTDSSRDRRALGTMSSGSNRVSCGLFAAPRKLCFSSVGHADVKTLLRSYVTELGRLSIADRPLASSTGQGSVFAAHPSAAAESDLRHLPAIVWAGC